MEEIGTTPGQKKSVQEECEAFFSRIFNQKKKGTLKKKLIEFIEELDKVKKKFQNNNRTHTWLFEICSKVPGGNYFLELYKECVENEE